MTETDQDGLTATVVETDVVLTWNTKENVSYTIKYGTASDQYSDEVADAKSPLVLLLPEGQTVFLRLFAHQSDGAIFVGGEILVEVPISRALPGDFGLLSAVSQSGKVSVVWDSAPHAKSYTIRRGTSSDAFPTLLSVDAQSPYEDQKDLISGTKYYYMVTAVSPRGSKNASTGAEVTFFTLPGTFSVTSARLLDGKVELTWDRAAGAAAYTVLRGETAGNYPDTLSAAAKSPFIDTTVVNGKTYVYLVVATNPAGSTTAPEVRVAAQSLPSPVVGSVVPAITPLSAPGAFTISSVASGDGQLTISWSASSHASTYTVKRGTTSGTHATTLSTTATSPYADTSLANGNTYYYMVTAHNATGSTSATAEASGSPIAAPGAFTFATLTPGNTQATIAWNASSNAATYTLRRGISTGSYPTILSSSATSPFVNTGLTNGTTYYYMVTGVNPTASTSATAEASVMPVTAPGAFSIAAGIGNNQVTLTWGASLYATTYTVKRGTATGVWGTTVSTTATSPFVDTGVSNGTTYFYMVTAVNPVGNTNASAEVSVTPSPPPGAFTMKGVPLNQKAIISWTASTGATSYTIKRGTATGVWGTTLSTSATSSYVDTGLVNGTTYYYMVTAVGAGGNTNATAEASVLGQTVSYFEVQGPDEATAKSGVTDSVTLQGITDAYANGFKAPGLVATDWQHSKAVFVDTSSDFADNPTLWGVGTSGSNAARVDLAQSKVATFSGFDSRIWTTTRGSCISVFHSAPFNYSNHRGQIWDSGALSFNFSTFQNAVSAAGGKVVWPTSITVYAIKTDNNIYKRTDTNLTTTKNQGTDSQIPTIQAEVSQPVLFGESRRPHPVGADFNDNLFYLEKTTWTLKKRTSGGTVTTVALPGTISGNVVAVSVRGNSTQTYMAILSATGQVFLSKDEGAWTDLGVSGVVGIDVGVRGSVVIHLKKDAVHTEGNPVLIKPGI